MSPTDEQEYLGEGEGQESIGCFAVVTHSAAKRILDWSKTLKSKALCLLLVVVFYYGTNGCRGECYESVYRSRNTSQLNGMRVEVLEREYG